MLLIETCRALGVHQIFSIFVHSELSSLYLAILSWEVICDLILPILQNLLIFLFRKFALRLLVEMVCHGAFLESWTFDTVIHVQHLVVDYVHLELLVGILHVNGYRRFLSSITRSLFTHINVHISRTIITRLAISFLNSRIKVCNSLSLLFFFVTIFKHLFLEHFEGHIRAILLCVRLFTGFDVTFSQECSVSFKLVFEGRIIMNVWVNSCFIIWWKIILIRLTMANVLTQG